MVQDFARLKPRLATLLLASSMLAAPFAARPAWAQTAAPPAAPTPPPSAQDGTALEEVVVTAQKREENLQNVPVSIQALGTATLEQRQVNNFGDFVKYLPSVSYQTVAPSVTNVYVRGVASGGDGNHSGPQPSVGIYLDEQPITTIQGALDVHIYDIARVESLSGPQGTLYGANSESGTIRIITNKPDPKKFSAGYDIEGNTVTGKGGGVIEGYVNQPITDKIALRVVAFGEHDAGYIDNVQSTRVFPSSGIAVDNGSRVKQNYNGVDTYGGRAALKIDLNENWTITPTIMAQDQRSRGVFGYDTTVGDLKVAHSQPEATHDRWAQAALTIEGHVHDFDIVYSGGYFRRNVDTQSDYSDYSFFYDQLFGSGNYTTDSAGNRIDPSQRIRGIDQFSKESHELRVSSPKDHRLRFVGGLFYEKQVHDIVQQYQITDLDPALSISNHPGFVWLTDQVRIDRDTAAFGEASFDLLSNLTVTGGVRVFESRNSLRGFYGFGGFGSSAGEAKCISPEPYRSAPCLSADKQVDETNVTYKGNVTYKIDSNKLIYFTASSGYRPGGVNRAGQLPPYVSDFLYNYEIGWKTSFFENRVRWNLAAFYEQWDNFQFSFLGANGLTQIANAGSAEIKGLETDVAWRPMRGLDISGAATFIDAHLTEPYCGSLNDDGTPVTSCAGSELAPNGQSLPVTPAFKGNFVARYSFPLGDDWQAHVQGAAVYQSSSWADLRSAERQILGRQKAYGSFDVATGIERNGLTIELFGKNIFDRRGQVYRSSECAASVCGAETYVVPILPREIGIRVGQKF